MFDIFMVFLVIATIAVGGMTFEMGWEKAKTIWIFAIIGAVIGAFIGSSFGIAHGGGAESGSALLGMLGFIAGGLLGKSVAETAEKDSSDGE